MALIRVDQPRWEQPQEACGVAPEYAGTCVHALLGSVASSSGIYDAATGTMLPVVGASGTVVKAGGVFSGSLGQFLRTDRASTSLSTTGRVLLGNSISQRQDTGEITIVAVLERVAATANGVISTGYNTPVSAGCYSLQWFNDNKWYCDVGDEDSRVAQTDTFTGSTVVVASWSNTDKRKRLWRDGVLIFNNTADTDSISAGTNDYIALANGIGAYAFCVFNRRLPNESDLSRNPWQLFQPRRIWVPQSASGGLPTLSLSTYKPGTLTTSGWTPRITAT